MLAVHGVHPFKQRLGVDTEVEAARVVRELLPSPLTTRILEANDRDLPTYAEAAPAEFLSILERDLKSDAPAVFGLLRPVDSGIFGSHPSRNGLLWALEGLSWSAETLPRAAFILARLAQIEINDNWANKPAHSLESIFRSWMPQTAASHDERVACIKKLAEDYPNVGWKICVAQFGDDHGMGGYSYKPRWRRDGFGFGNPFPTWEPVVDFQCEMVEMALRWKEHTLSTLSDLVVRLHALDDAYQARVWALIETWANANADDAEKATLREKIRVTALSRRAAQRAQQNAGVAALSEKARAAYAALEPRDLLNKHAWLFRDIWVEESADEIEEIDDFDFQNRDERIHKLRVAAMHEIRDARGLAGLLELAERGKASSQIGVLAAHDLLSEQELQELLRLALRSVLEDGKDAYSHKNIIGGAVRAISEDDKRDRILKAVAADLAEEDTARLLMLASFARNTWKQVDELSEAAQARYWRDVVPDWIRNSDEETNEAVERLLKAGRPRAAFSCVRLHPGKVDVQVLFRLLSEMAVGGNDKSGEYMLEHYDVERAFKCIDASPVLTLEQKARLEFAYLDALARPRGNRAIPNLERYIEAHPEVYVQAIVWLYMRTDGGADPAEFQAPQDRMKTMAERGYQLLEAVVRMPGHDDLGELKADRLAKWVTSVRQTCAELSRAEIADRCIGKLLAHAQVGQDGVWPCEPVRQVMEDIQSESIMQGAHTGVYNSRGVHWRGEGGDQERKLGEKYRKWGLALQLSHPYVSVKLLMELAKTYEREANREDTEAGIRRRLR